MRLLIVQVPRGKGSQVIDLAVKHHGMNLSRFDAQGQNGPLEVNFIHISNNKVDPLLSDLQGIDDLSLTLIPRGVIALKPPQSEAPQQVVDVNPRSSLEIFLAGLQSIGSWKAYLGYAAAATVIVWIGFITNTIYLLTAAMLLAPLAAPAMNTAVATARGDWVLFRISLWRYFVAILLTIVLAGLLSLIFGQKTTTSLMVATSELSSVSILLPLVAGAAGALNLVQSERSSLVAGAAVGMLVSVSLAPPAALAGIAVVLNDWIMVKSSLFSLVQTLIGINLSGAIIFRLYGLNANGVRYKRGKSWITLAILASTFLLLIGITVWQLQNQPDLQRSTRARKANEAIQEVVNNMNSVSLVELNVRFARTSQRDQNTLLVDVYVERNPSLRQSVDEIRQDLIRKIQDDLISKDFQVLPLVSVHVFEPPSQ